jgi:hypothetical protein
MAKKNSQLTTVCQDCLNNIPDKVILKYNIPESKVGPAYTIMLCKSCVEKRNKK